MFEKIKLRLLERIERNAVKSTLTYNRKKDSDPVTETVYLKRSKMPLVGDWARIYPPVNEDGSWNLINVFFGGGKNLIKLLVIVAVMAFVFMGYAELFSQYTSLSALYDTCLEKTILLLP